METLSACGPGRIVLESAGMEGDTPVLDWESAAYDTFSESRVA
jgi:hypothetical protein